MTKGKTKDGLEYLWTDKKRTLFGLPLSFTRYYLTESRLITRIGLLTVVEDELDIYRITDKNGIAAGTAAVRLRHDHSVQQRR